MKRLEEERERALSKPDVPYGRVKLQDLRCLFLFLIEWRVNLACQFTFVFFYLKQDLTRGGDGAEAATRKTIRPTHGGHWRNACCGEPPWDEKLGLHRHNLPLQRYNVFLCARSKMYFCAFE